MDRKEYLRNYQREYVARRRREFFDGRRCVSCGGVDNLELDHVDRRTKVDHRIWSWSKERRDAEIEKCQVLCRPCHHRKTGAENRVFEHGKRWTYERHGCRCSLCKGAKRSHNAKRFAPKA